MSKPTLADLLNRVAVRTQPKRHMLEEFGITTLTDALAAKFISEDFYNYGITDLGLSKRAAIQTALRVEIASSRQPAKPVQITPAPAAMQQEPAMLKSHAELMAAINRSENGLTINELEAELGITTPTLRNRIADLSNQNRIVRVGQGLPGRPYRYCTPEQAADIESEQPEIKDAEPVQPTVTLENALALYAFDPELAPEPTVEPTHMLEIPKPALEFQPALLNLEQPAGLDPEITAMQTMLAALVPLDDMARSRAIGWVSSRLRMS